MILNDYTSVDISNLSQFIAVINEHVHTREYDEEIAKGNNLYWYIDDLHEKLNHLYYVFDNVIDDDIELYKCAREILDTHTELEYWQQFSKHANRLDNNMLTTKKHFTAN